MKQEYQKRNNQAKWFLILVVGGILGLVVWMSFDHTRMLAKTFHLNPLFFAGMVEASFLTTVVIRSRQRTQGKNVPLFLNITFWFFFCLVTATNVWGLSGIQGGAYVGVSISLGMLALETILVWWCTRSEEKAEPTLFNRLMALIKRRIVLYIQLSELEYDQYESWKLDEAQEKSLKVVKKGRKLEKKRMKSLGDDYGQYFSNKHFGQNVIDLQAKREERTDKKKVETVNIADVFKTHMPDIKPIGQIEPYKPQELAIETDRQTIIQTESIMQTSDTNINNSDDGQKIVQTKPVRQPKSSIDKQKAFQTAQDYMSENGHLPSVRKLKDLAGVSKYVSEKVLSEMRHK